MLIRGSTIPDTRTEVELVSVCGFELYDELGGHSAAVFDVEALCFGPLSDFGVVDGVRFGFASRAGRPSTVASDVARRLRSALGRRAVAWRA